MQNLTQYEYLDRDMLMQGVVEWIVKESPLTGVLPMKTIAGNSFKYNVEVGLPTASWTTVGTQLSESTGRYEPRTTDIYTMIQTAYTDKSKIVLNLTQNPEAIDIALAAKALAHEFEKTLIIGRTSVNTKALQFKGLLRILAEMETVDTIDLDGINNSQVIVQHASGASLTMEKMDELVDAIKPGKPDMLLMSRRARRKLNALSRASGSSGLTLTDAALFGIKMMHYDEIPILVSDWLLDNYAVGSSSVLDITAYDFNDATRDGSTSNTVILALQIGEDKVTGLQAGQMTHEREEFVEDFNAIANRFVWYCGAACFKKYSIAALINVYMP